jgi:hypothetical protein
MGKICKNGIIRDRTPEEDAELIAHREKNAIYDAEKEVKRAARKVNQDSVKAKLEALGLTADEVRDTFGLLS